MIVQKQFSIKFLPSKKTVKVPKDYNLRQAILDCGIDIESSCGGVGTCGRCKVKVVSGHVHSKKSKFINSYEKREGYVLSCLAKVEGDLIVFVPEIKVKKVKIEEGSLELTIDKVYTSIKKDELAAVEIKPWIIKEKIKVEKPSLNYNINDLYRLQKSVKNKLDIENITVPVRVLRKLPFLLRESDWEILATVDKSTKTLMNIQKASNEKKCFGIALDIGTTTLVMRLVDLYSGEVIGSTSEYNPQIKFGEDIINRIVYSIKKGGLNRLREAVIDSINGMILKLLADYKINEEDVVAVMIAGNSTMMHIFYGVSPKFIREEPYVTVANKFAYTSADELELKYIKNAFVYSIEGVTSYLGGDITSGVLATDIANKKELTLFIDLGTNGELVVGNSEWLMGCSCSAGPAFEGGGVRCGVRAVEGAIEKVIIDQNTYKCFYEVIGNQKPVGICGSGLIDLLGEMYLKGVIDRKGKFNKDIGNPYLRCVNDDCYYILVDAENSSTGEDIVITEVDINNLMRAKAAVYAGIKTLLEEVDLNLKDIEKVYIAGGLGKNINIQNAVVIGMLPDIDLGRYSFLGNTSVTGAYLCLLSENKYKYSEEIANKITYLELSMNLKFMDRYIAGLFLPYTDLKDFPTVESLLYSI